jgi:Txe/YoeB family toxin of Txe-Axe toxin-antitoxin module
MNMELFWTTRFVDNYNRYNGQRARIRAKINDLIKKYESNPSTWIYDFERIRDNTFELYREKITHGDRLIFAIEANVITFVDVGPHEVMSDFVELSNSVKREIVAKRNSIPDYFLEVNDPNLDTFAINSSKQGFDNSEMRWLYEEELGEAWLQYLDNEQYQISKKIFTDVSQPGNFEFHLLLGGAGTGKSIVLLNLILSLSENGRSVVSIFQNSVAKYLQSGKQKIPGLQIPPHSGSVVVQDDPLNFDELLSLMKNCRKEGVRALVVALDPLQWTERRVLEKFNELIEVTGPKIHTLQTCYRQSFEIGSKAVEVTKNVLNLTNPFINESKIAAHNKQISFFKELCVDKVNFVDKGGRYRIYSENIHENFLLEFQRFLAREDRWTHWHPLLIVHEGWGLNLPKKWRDITTGNNVVYKDIDQLNQIRGCEYQEVYIYVKRRTWDSLMKESLGAGSAEWEKKMAFHTILTRAKDCLVIFLESDDSN